MHQRKEIMRASEQKGKCHCHGNYRNQAERSKIKYSCRYVWYSRRDSCRWSWPYSVSWKNQHGQTKMKLCASCVNDPSRRLRSCKHFSRVSKRTSRENDREMYIYIYMCDSRCKWKVYIFKRMLLKSLSRAFYFYARR